MPLKETHQTITAFLTLSTWSSDLALSIVEMLLKILKVSGCAMASESKCGKTVPNTLENFISEKPKEKAHFITLTTISTKVISEMEKQTEKVFIHIKMDPNIEGIGRMTFKMVKELNNGLMEHSMKATLKWERNMAMESMSGQTAASMTVPGL